MAGNMENMLNLTGIRKHVRHSLTAGVMLTIPLWPGTVFSAGYQIPNQSMRAVGIAGATIAHSPGAESSYYNPANMSFLENLWQVEASLTMLGLPSIEYTDNRSPLLDGTSDSELFYLPQLHLVSKKYHDFRFGFSLTYPYGLAKEWDQPYPAATVKRFALSVIEANPVFSYALSKRVSIGGGVRLIYGDGEVENIAVNPPFSQLDPLERISRKVDGDDTRAGYNLAVAYRPAENWSLAATYRSEVNLDLQGNASFLASAFGMPVGGHIGSVSLELPLPAVFSVAASYTLSDLTLEIAWSRTYWSAVEDLDFEYEQSFYGTLFDGFDRPQQKNWDDSDALRLGLTWEVVDSFRMTFGFAIDNTPVREETLGFELPDADAYMYSAGLQYDCSEKLTLGLSYMYHHTTSRSVSSQAVAGIPGINGSFDEGGAHAVNFGAQFRF